MTRVSRCQAQIHRHRSRQMSPTTSRNFKLICLFSSIKTKLRASKRAFSIRPYLSMSMRFPALMIRTTSRVRLTNITTVKVVVCSSRAIIIHWDTVDTTMHQPHWRNFITRRCHKHLRKLIRITYLINFRSKTSIQICSSNNNKTSAF